MTPRVLVLFARAPLREARDKGFAGAAGERLFAAFAEGWIDAARRCGARLVVSSPSVDRTLWNRFLAGTRFEFLEQRGASFGARLEDAARRAAAKGGDVVLVGGDVAPSARKLADAFTLRASGADAVLSAARDGGVSLVTLREEDLDLLGRFAPRRADVFARLAGALALRHRRVAAVEPAGDVDGRRELGRLLRASALSSPELERLARAVLDASRTTAVAFAVPRASASHIDTHASRGPPLAA